MEEHIIFKSNSMKTILKRNNIGVYEFARAFHNITIDGNELNLDGAEYQNFIADIAALQPYANNNIDTVFIKNMDLSGKPEMFEAISKFAKISNVIGIENSKFDSVEKAFQTVFDKPSETNANLAQQNNMIKLVYDRTNKNTTIDSQNIKYLEDYNKYIDSKNIIVELSSGLGKQDIIDNIDILRNQRGGTVFLRDVSPEKNITELSKYESYANGNIVLFKSNILKQSMGIDRLPAHMDLGVYYNLKIDGKSILQNAQYNLEGEELELFLKDLQEISKYCPLSGISIKNINIPEGADLSRLSEIMGAANRINIEDSNIPNLKDVINGIEDKSNIEKIIVKESGIDLEDINTVAFPNIDTLSIERKPVQQLENTNIIETTDKQTKTPWYRKLLDKVKKLPVIKKILGEEEIKALPAANETVVPTKRDNKFEARLQEGVPRNIDIKQLQKQHEVTRGEVSQDNER